MKACSTCAHGQAVVGHLPIYGLDEDNHPPMVECRFHAPQPITGPINDNFDRISYPPLQAHDYWCGQWEPQEPRFLDRELWKTVAKTEINAKYMQGRDAYGCQTEPQAPAPQEQIVTYDSVEDLTA